MPLEARLLTGLAIALAVVYWATPIAIRVADRFEFYDKPRGYKGHARPTPYLGGSALVLGFVVALLLLASDWERTLPVVGGVVALWLVGTIDDRRPVLWWLRVAIEVGLAAALWAADLGWSLGLGGAVDLAATAVWVVVVVNAFNLFDNMDGQSSTMGLVCASGIAVLGLVNDDAWLAIGGTALAGACVGFLPHNLLARPARIFLGDGGSMPLGFAAAAFAMIGASGAASEWQALVLGLLLVGVPALDTCLVIVSRRRRGLSILTAGRDHLTHRAHQRLRTAIAVAVALGSAQVVLSLLAVAAAEGGALALGGSAVLYLVGVGVVVALVDTRIPAVPPPVEQTEPSVAAVPARRLPEWLVPEAPILVVLGVGAGISPLLSGYYDSGVWAPIGLGLIVVLLATVIARPPRLQAPAMLALAGLAGLALWSLVSALWADSIDQAVVEANRTFALATALALLVVLVRDARTALWALGAFAATALVVLGVQFVRLLGSDAASLFVGGRLDDPLGYINAQATFVLLLMWPAIAVAEQRRSAIAAGAAAAVVTVCGGLLLLSQSRGAALALIASALVVLALAPGRLRRLALFAVVGGAVAVASSELLDVFRSRVIATGAVDAGTVNDAVVLLLAVAAFAGAAWGLAVFAARSLRPEALERARRGMIGALAVAALVSLVVGLASFGGVRDEVRSQYDAFVHLSVGQGGEQTASRLLSGGGNRYDYWRVAARAARDKPVGGVGAGNYDEPYFLERTTPEDIRQPHSLVMQALAELGAIGAALALAFLAAFGWAALRWRAAARRSRLERALLCGALGTAAAWTAHTQVDWIHLLPGVTAGALIAGAVLLRPVGDRVGAPRRRGPRVRAAIAIAVAFPVAIAGVSLSRQVLAEHYRGEAHDALVASDPAEAVRQADRSLRLDPEALAAYYTKAAAVARQGDGDGARRILEAARRREPGDFLPYALLGDLAVRQRDFDAAATYYRAALDRNPREPSLVLLAEDPRAARR